MNTPITIKHLSELGIPHRVWNGVIKEYYIRLRGNFIISFTFGERIGEPNTLHRVGFGTSTHSGTLYIVDSIKTLEQVRMIYEGITGESFDNIKK